MPEEVPLREAVREKEKGVVSRVKEAVSGIQEVVVPTIPSHRVVFAIKEWKAFRDSTVHYAEKDLDVIDRYIGACVTNEYCPTDEAKNLRRRYETLVGKTDLYKRTTSKNVAEKEGRALTDEVKTLYRDTINTYTRSEEARRKAIIRKTEDEEREEARREAEAGWEQIQTGVRGMSDVLKAGAPLTTEAMEAIFQAHRSATSIFTPPKREVVVVEKPPEVAVSEMGEGKPPKEAVTWTDKIVAYAKKNPLQLAGMVILGAVTARIAIPLVTGAISSAKRAKAKKYAFKGE